MNAMRRNCLFVSFFFPPPMIGGSIVYYHYLLSECTSQDVVVVTHKQPDSAEFDADMPYTVRRSRAIRDPRSSRLRRLGWYVLLAPTFLAWIVRFGASVVHLGVWTDIIPGFVASRLLGRALVVTIHGEELTTQLSASRGFVFRRMWQIHDGLAQRALRGADRVIANSQFTKGVLLEHGVQEDRIVVITPGADASKATYKTSPDRSLVGRLAGKRVLLTVGRLEFRKGQDMVLRALPALLRVHPDLHYVMAGGSTPEMHEYFHELIQELRLKDNVTVLPDLSDEAIAYLYDACEVFIMANREMPNGDTEGYGIVFLEAGAWGKPVIGGRAGGVVEAVDDGVTGLLVDGTSVDEITGAIARLLADRSLAARMGQAGGAKAKACSWKAKAEQYRALIGQLAVSSRRRR
jgi:phosphatidylinositol alpha-1,6-mannosyltransferase